MIAVSALTVGAPAEVAAAHLRETDAGACFAAPRTWPAPRAARTRESFTSFGTCSVLEPVEDLVALGLLSDSHRTSA